MSETESFVRVEKLAKHFGATRVFDDLSFGIDRGEFITLLGPSGCGKSTLLRCLAGLETPDAGTIFVGGADITNVKAQKRGIGMVFQSYALFPNMTAAENIAFGLKMNGVPAAETAKKVSDAVALVELSGNEKKYPHQLSGGQKQRVGIARALASDPKVLLSDEATSALDPETTVATLQLLKQINRDLGLTIVMITHQMDVVKEICDRVAVMNKGVVVEEGPVIDVFRRPQSETARAMVGNIMGQEIAPAMVERIRAQVKAVTDGIPNHILRLTFVGSEVTRPIISEASRLFNVDFNILLGQIAEVQGKSFGTLTVLTKADADTLSKTVAYFREHNVTVEEKTNNVL